MQSARIEFENLDSAGRNKMPSILGLNNSVTIAGLLTHHELTDASIDQLRKLLAQLDAVCQQAKELSAHINEEMAARARANRPAKSNAAKPKPRRVARKTDR